MVEAVWSSQGWNVQVMAEEACQGSCTGTCCCRGGCGCAGWLVDVRPVGRRSDKQHSHPGMARLLFLRC